jgi:sec-independent protein translocase protein TatC
MVEKTVQLYFPFLMEVRRRLLFTFSVFLIASILGFFYYEPIIRFIIGFINLEGVNIVFTSPFQFVNLAISSAFLVGITISFPLIILQVLSFLKPALRPREFKLIISLLPLILLLFVFGFIFGFFIMRYVINLFYVKSLELEIGNLLDISSLLSQILITSTLMGLAFQYPIVLTLLIRFKVVKLKMIAHQRPFVYLIILIFAALLPPTDVLSLVLLSLPLAILFETTLILNKLFLRR